MVETLDVGSGDRPKGDVNVDLYQGISPSLQEYRSNVKIGANFVQATVYTLPFKDACFNHVLCHHLLEHLKQPDLAIKELCRVSRVHVEVVVPFKWHELIQNWFRPDRRAWASQNHLWFFTKQQLEQLCISLGLNARVSYRYKFGTALNNFKVHNIRDFKSFIFYGILEAVLPPTPGELKVTIHKQANPVKRAK